MADEGENGRRPALRLVPGGATRARVEDEGLVAAFLVGDEEGFAELVRRTEPLLLSILRRYARTPEDARDLAQRTFLKALEAARRATRVRRRQPFPWRRWVIRIAVNLAKNHVRDEGRWTRAPLAALEGPGRPAPAPGGGPDETLSRAEDAARVRRAVLRLPRRQREVLTLRIDAELPFADVADALGITENAAKVTFHHATRRLRELARDEAGAPAARPGEERP